MWRGDPYSPGATFTGWRRAFGKPRDPNYEPLDVTPPRTKLLVSEWRFMGGLIGRDERPGRLL